MSASPFGAISPGTPCFFSLPGQTGGWRRVGWGVGVTFAAVVLSEVVGGVCGVFVFFEDVGRCLGTMCLTCLAGDVMERGADGSAQLPPAKFGSVGRVDGRVERSARSYVRARAFYFSPTSHHSAKRTSPQNRFAHHPPAAGRGSSSVSFSSQSL